MSSLHGVFWLYITRNPLRNCSMKLVISVHRIPSGECFPISHLLILLYEYFGEAFEAVKEFSV